MPNLGAKFSSSYITVEVMLEFIAQLPAQLRPILSSPKLTVSYGWGCNLHPDLWHKPMNVGLDLFPYLTRCTLDIILETAMGRQLDTQNNKDSKYELRMGMLKS